MTAEIAKTWLENNFKNRPLSQRRVSIYAALMEGGQWTDSIDAIGIHPDGSLANGQHRLSAVVKYGKPVKMAIAYDVPRGVVIDKGKSRTTADSLYMRDKISRRVANNFAVAIAKFYLEIVLKREPTDDEIADFLNQHELAILHVIEISNMGGSGVAFKILRNAPAQAAILGAYFAGYSWETIERFAYVCHSGFCSNDSESAAIVLRNTKSIIGKRPKQGDRRTYSFTVQAALKCFAEGKPRKKAFVDPQNLFIK